MRTIRQLRNRSLAQYIAKEMLETHAFYEWVAFLVYKDFSRRNPGMDLTRYMAKEEHAHFSLLKKIYPGTWGKLQPATARRLKKFKLPVIKSELEFYIASWIFDLSGQIQIQGLANCSWLAYRKVARKILQDELEHKNMGLKNLKLYLQKNPGKRKTAVRLMDKWLKLSSPSFGSVGSPFDHLAVRLGLKRVSSLNQKKQFENIVKKARASL